MSTSRIIYPIRQIRAPAKIRGKIRVETEPDGSGYPDGISKLQVPVEARIVHLADVFDALTTRRVYKHAWSSRDAAGVLRESRGRMFDPDVVDAFEALYARGDIGAP